MILYDKILFMFIQQNNLNKCIMKGSLNLYYVYWNIPMLFCIQLSTLNLGHCGYNVIYVCTESFMNIWRIKVCHFIDTCRQTWCNFPSSSSLFNWKCSDRETFMISLITLVTVLPSKSDLTKLLKITTYCHI